MLTDRSEPCLDRREPGDVLSPELALVDPELAERARLALPSRDRIPRAIDAAPRPRAHAEVPVQLAAPAAAQSGRRRPKPAYLLAAVLVALGLVGTAGALERNAPQPELMTARPPAPPAPVAATREPGPSASTAPQAPALPRPVPRARRPAPVPRPPPRPARPAAPDLRRRPAIAPRPAPPAPTLDRAGRAAAPSRPAAASSTTGPAAEAAPTLPAPRIFVWAPVAGAEAYRISFYRDGTQIYEATAALPRHELPPRWTFGGRQHELTAGTYRWVVVPLVPGPDGVLDGEPVVDSVYTV